MHVRNVLQVQKLLPSKIKCSANQPVSLFKKAQIHNALGRVCYVPLKAVYAYWITKFTTVLWCL